MKKSITLLLTAIFMISAFSSQVFAANPKPDELVAQLDKTMTEHLPGISADSKKAILDFEKTYLASTDGTGTTDTDKTNKIMSTYRLMREAHEAGQAEKVEDVINEYYKLSSTAKTTVMTKLTEAFQNIGFTVVQEPYKLILNNGATTVTTITFAEIAPKSVTRIYLESYIPALTTDAITQLETLVSEYGKMPGSSPSGSGKFWSNTRKIGEAMGVVATYDSGMESGVVSVTVTQPGETYLRNCTVEVQNQVLALANEAAIAIGTTPEYKDGVFTMTKDGVVRFEWLVMPIRLDEVVPATTSTATTTSTTTPTTTPTQTTVEGAVTSPKTGDSGSAVVALSVCGLAVLTAVIASKKKSVK